MARGDVLLVELPDTGGREQSGRRPATAVQTDIAGEPMLMIAPITSNLKALRYKFPVGIDPTATNGLTMPSVVMVFQMRAVDKTRIVRTLGVLSDEDMSRVDEAIELMLKP